MLSFLKRINTLKKMPRIGWIEGGVALSGSEDVAQHSYETAVIVLLLLNRLDDNLDRERALSMALVHDWAESITGDFSREMSEEIGVELKEEIEEKVLSEVVLDDISEREKYIDLWREFASLETRESKIVSAADKLSILVEALQLFKRGERSEKLIEIWRTTYGELESLGEEMPVLEDILIEFERDLPSDLL